MRILLVCAGGMSTGLLLKKMETYWKEQGEELSINAVGLAEYKDVYQDYDVVLVGPQVRYKLEDIRKDTGLPTDVVNFSKQIYKERQLTMEKYTGKKVFGGIAIGKIHFCQKEEHVVVRRKNADAGAEWERYEKARTVAIGQLKQLYEKALKTVGELNAQIFEVHSMVLEDEDYSDSIRNMIKTQGVNAEYAETVTLSGKTVNLYANIGSISDLAAVLKNDAEGIGLFRSEFLYLQKDCFPTEEEQFQVYRQVAGIMAGKKVIIRAGDI